MWFRSRSNLGSRSLFSSAPMKIHTKRMKIFLTHTYLYRNEEIGKYKVRNKNLNNRNSSSIGLTKSFLPLWKSLEKIHKIKERYYFLKDIQYIPTHKGHKGKKRWQPLQILHWKSHLFKVYFKKKKERKRRPFTQRCVEHFQSEAICNWLKQVNTSIVRDLTNDKAVSSKEEIDPFKISKLFICLMSRTIEAERCRELP